MASQPSLASKWASKLYDNTLYGCSLTVSRPAHVVVLLSGNAYVYGRRLIVKEYAYGGAQVTVASKRPLRDEDKVPAVTHYLFRDHFNEIQDALRNADVALCDHSIYADVYAHIFASMRDGQCMLLLCNDLPPNAPQQYTDDDILHLYIKCTECALYASVHTPLPIAVIDYTDAHAEAFRRLCKTWFGTVYPPTFVKGLTPSMLWNLISRRALNVPARPNLPSFDDAPLPATTVALAVDADALVNASASDDGQMIQTTASAAGEDAPHIDPIVTPPPALTPAQEPSSGAECVVCLERTKCVVCLPCKHLCLCKECSNELLDCPMCRAHILDKMSVFV